MLLESRRPTAESSASGSLGMHLLVSCGALECSEIDIGHSWSPTDASGTQNRMESSGIAFSSDELDEDRSWLDHALALATGTLQPIDHYFEGYDVAKAKTEWGRSVLAKRRDLDYDDEEASDSNDENGEGEGAGRKRKQGSAGEESEGKRRRKDKGDEDSDDESGVSAEGDILAEEVWDLAEKGILPWNRGAGVRLFL